MAIGKKRSGSHRVIGAQSDSAKAEKKRLAAQLAQKSAQENIAANRQLDTARAQAATPGRAESRLMQPSLISAPTPSHINKRLAHDKAMQTERLAHTSAENEKGRAHQASESKLSREHQSSENALGREHSARMQDASLASQRQMQTERLRNQSQESALQRKHAASESELARKHAANESALGREHQITLRDMDITAQRERDKTLHGYNMERDKGRYEHETLSDLARRAHDKEILGIKNQSDYEQWLKRQEYLRQQEIAAENRRYGIPENAEMSNEDRAKIINGKGRYEYGYGRTPEEEERIAAIKGAIDSPNTTEEDRARLRQELEIYEKEHPARGRAVEVPPEQMAPKTTDVNGNTYMFNNGRWERVDEPSSITRKEEIDMRRKDLDAKRYQDVLLKLEQGYKTSIPIKDEATGAVAYKDVMQPYTPEQKEKILRQLFPDRFPAAGGEGAPAPSPTPTPEQQLAEIQAQLPEGYSTVPQENGEIHVKNPQGRTDEIVAPDGTRYRIIYGPDGMPTARQRI